MKEKIVAGVLAGAITTFGAAAPIEAVAADGNVNLDSGKKIVSPYAGLSPQEQFSQSMQTLGFRVDLKSTLAVNEMSADLLPDRIFGADRYETAVKIAKEGWADGSCKNVVLAYGGSEDKASLAETIASGPLASALNAPILLTDGATLTDATFKEIKDLGVETVYIPSKIIKENVLNQLKTSGINIKTVYGNNAPATSVEIAKTIASINPDYVKNQSAALVNGSIGTPDALSIVAIACAQDFPILITDNKDNLPSVVKDYLMSNSTINKTYIIGGTGVIGDNQKSEVAGAVRLAGSDRYETNKAVIAAFSNQVKFDNVFLANGETLVDALSGGPLAAKYDAVIALTDGANVKAADVIAPLFNENGTVTALGGESVVSTAAINKIGDSSAEFTIPADAIDIGATKVALDYKAGGKFENPNNSNIFAITDVSTGAVVKFADADFQALDQKLASYKNGKLTTDQLLKKYLDESVIGKIRKNLKKGDFVYVMGGEAYVFDQNSKNEIKPVIKRITATGNISQVSENMESRFYAAPSIVWNEIIGIGLSDGYKISYKYNTATNNFEELTDYVMLGTPEQRMKSHIRSMFDSKLTSDISEEDVKKYEQTGSTEGCKTIKVLNDAEGKPAFFVICGGQYGFDEKVVEATENAVKRLNEIDSKFVRMLSDKFGLSCITYDLTNEISMNGNITKYSNAIYKKRFGNGIIFYNSVFRKDYSLSDHAINLMYLCFTEARGIYDSEHLKRVNGSYVFESIDKILSTGATGVEKQAWSLRMVEIFNMQDKYTPLDEKVEIRSNTIGVFKHNPNGKLTISEYSRSWSTAVGGFNTYIKSIK